SSTYSPIILLERTENGAHGITFYPNPVENKTVTVSLSNMNKGRYHFALYNSAGQAVYRSQIEHNGGSAYQTIVLPPAVSSGLYSIQVKGEDGTFHQLLFVK
ncbi:MAG: T9SS type A sorting domain-containing protein, partial [Flavisolibacter sp.]|nr:T9SS type A sorting domain-containing protein [Flavisolibacter sp.]